MRHMSYWIFNFCAELIIECKNWIVRIQLDSKLNFNWSLIMRHVSIHFLIFVISELFGAKIEESKSIKF